MTFDNFVWVHDDGRVMELDIALATPAEWEQSDLSRSPLWAARLRDGAIVAVRAPLVAAPPPGDDDPFEAPAVELPEPIRRRLESLPGS